MNDPSAHERRSRMVPGGIRSERSTIRCNLEELQDRLRAVQAELEAFHDVVSTIVQGARELLADSGEDELR